MPAQDSRLASPWLASGQTASLERNAFPYSASTAADKFDNQDATYILAIDKGEIVGGSRLIPTTHPHLLSEVFPHLAVIKSRREGRTMGGQTRGMVICGVLEHCHDNGIAGLTAFVEMSWLPLFHAMGWKLIPLGLPELISGEWSVAVKMQIDKSTLESTRALHGMTGGAVIPLNQRQTS